MNATTETRLDRIMAEIESLGVGTPEYHDAVAFLLTIMAKRRQWIIADSIRRSRADSERRRAAARRRKE